MNNDWESKDIYLSKEGCDCYYGLHSVGITEDGTWLSMEAWCNIYDLNKKFVASTSRIFGSIESAAEDFKRDGWVVVKDW